MDGGPGVLARCHRRRTPGGVVDGGWTRVLAVGPFYAGQGGMARVSRPLARAPRAGAGACSAPNCCGLRTGQCPGRCRDAGPTGAGVKCLIAHRQCRKRRGGGLPAPGGERRNHLEEPRMERREDLIWTAVGLFIAGGLLLGMGIGFAPGQPGRWIVRRARGRDGRGGGHRGRGRPAPPLSPRGCALSLAWEWRRDDCRPARPYVHARSLCHERTQTGHDQAIVRPAPGRCQPSPHRSRGHAGGAAGRVREPSGIPLSRRLTGGSGAASVSSP